MMATALANMNPLRSGFSREYLRRCSFAAEAAPTTDQANLLTGGRHRRNAPFADMANHGCEEYAPVGKRTYAPVPTCNCGNIPARCGRGFSPEWNFAESSFAAKAAPTGDMRINLDGMTWH